VAIQLKGIQLDGVYSSPLQRALNTARIITGKEPVIDHRLIEADFGLWENKTKEEFIAENEQLWINWMTDPSNSKAGGTGETGLDVVHRVDDFFKQLLAEKKSGTYLVAAHNGVNRLYMSYKLGMPLKNYRRLLQLNSAITQFTLDEDDVFTLQMLNGKL